MKSWKKGAINGGVVGLLVIAGLVVIESEKAFIAVLFYPDFLIAGAVIGYLIERYISKSK